MKIGRTFRAWTTFEPDSCRSLSSTFLRKKSGKKICEWACNTSNLSTRAWLTHHVEKESLLAHTNRARQLVWHFFSKALRLEESGCHRRKAQSKSATRKLCRSLGLLLVVVLGDTFITASTAEKNVTVKCLFNHRTTNWGLTGWTIFEI